MSAIDTAEVKDESAEEEGAEEFARLKRMVKEGWQTRSAWRKEAKTCFDFVAGQQWSEDDMKILREQNRPAVTFNRIAPIIKAVCGLEVNNRQGIIFLPRTEAGNGPDEIRTAAAKWVRDECNAEFEESDAFRDTATCGEGWTETRMEYDEDPKGKIIEERIYPLEMGVNAGSQKANYSDARMIFRVQDMTTLDAKDMFPGYLSAAIHCRWLGDDITPADGGEGNKKDYPEETREGVGGHSTLKKCRVVQAQWWERQTSYLVAQEGVDELQELSAEDFAKFKERADMVNASAAETGEPAISYEHVAVPKRVYYEAFLGSDGILMTADGQGKRELPMNMFQFKAMTGERDHEARCFYGLVRDMLDPQRWANKWLSQTMNIMNTNAKGGIMAEKTAFENIRKAQQDWSDPTKIIWVKDGKLDRVKDRTPPPMPQGLNDLMNFALTSLRDVSGINLELLGQADREQASSLEAQRKQSAMTILATIFDSLRRYRMGQGRLILYFIDLLPDNTLIRIIDKGAYKFIPLVKNKENVTYDVIVDDAPSSPNQKQLQWAVITQLLTTGIPLPPPVIFKLLKYSPLSESVVAEIEEAAGMGAEMPPEQLKIKLQQAEQALQVLTQQLQEALEETKQAKDDSAIKMMELEIKEYDAETKRLAAQWGKLGDGDGSLDVNTGGENNDSLQSA